MLTKKLLRSSPIKIKLRAEKDREEKEGYEKNQGADHT